MINTSLKYTRVTNDELARIFDSSGMYKLYDSCFGVEPYLEDLQYDDVYQSFEKYSLAGVLYLCLDGDTAVCFCGAMPLMYQQDVYEIVKDHIDDADKFWYHADIGTHPRYRGQGLAKKMLQAVIEIIPANLIIMRALEKNMSSINLHRKCGFCMLVRLDGALVTQKVESLRKSGEILTDTRIFMTYEK